MKAPESLLCLRLRNGEAMNFVDKLITGAIVIILYVGHLYLTNWLCGQCLYGLMVASGNQP